MAATSFTRSVCEATSGHVSRVPRVEEHARRMGCTASALCSSVLRGREWGYCTSLTFRVTATSGQFLAFSESKNAEADGMRLRSAGDCPRYPSHSMAISGLLYRWNYGRLPSVISGYYKRPDLNADETIFAGDGWMRTGDVGRWNEDGTLTLIDRIKNLVKLAGGEYIALEALESTYKSCNYVANICVHATQDAKAPIAIIPHEQNLRAALKERERRRRQRGDAPPVRGSQGRGAGAAGVQRGGEEERVQGDGDAERGGADAG
ncbi:hypothetical protein B0H16DRAFT_1893679 [Mycena metata]|uniref:AMP-dependent synthetase/ligase domain-containing protein n=1 Tax=Mycena metata TaxID=1033252 RepID=A0AAD7HX08_9AGAR|nr:hypothetical protein B0H16DRAFT_1893679 [Mycena metata]